MSERIQNYDRYYSGQAIDPQGSIPYCEWRCRKVSKKHPHIKNPKGPKERKVKKKIWLVDASGHAGAINDRMDGVEKRQRMQQMKRSCA